MRNFGEELSPILEEIGNAIVVFNADVGAKPNYTEEAFKSSIIIFMSTMMDKLYELQDKEKLPQQIREDMATQLGLELRNFVKTYTDMDTHKIFD